MTRPWHIWLAFGCCLAVVLAALAWTSATVLRLDEAARRESARAALEENVRLALWRIDSSVAGLIARENARPYFVYNAFYPAGQPYEQLFQTHSEAEQWIASPLLSDRPGEVLLHFQFDPDGRLSSPQVADPSRLRWAASEGLEERVKAAEERLRELAGRLDRERLLASLPPHDPLPPPLLVAQPVLPNSQGMQQQAHPSQSAQRSTNEFRARAQSYQQLAVANSAAMALGGDEVQAGVIQPVWAGSSLVLARQVTAGGRTYIQGCCLDWSKLQESLLDGIKDLLPGARLEPVQSQSAENPERMLAALPVRLVPGPAAVPPAEFLSPIQLSLVVAWACALLAAVAVAVLLFEVLALSERRSAFVSSVTHELRTPLCTFRMYAEMLAEGMVPDKSRQQQYLYTLRVEADRLSHLVENVLAYARLERGRRTRVDTLALDSLLEQATPRLADRAQQAGLQLAVELPEAVRSVEVRADAGAVEQVLFNLVDNACKYAAGATPAEVRLEVEAGPSVVLLRVRDRGPGIPRRAARRLFRPFSKSAHEAAHSAPGVGLGLALSRRLARQMGGDLKLESNSPEGACFVLRLARVGG